MNFKTKSQAMGTGIAIGAALGFALMGLTRFGAGGLAIGIGLGVALGSYLGRGLPKK
ncbi:hypothetical protein GCM10022631_21740 [Deinococcus rubellus]|uniref:Glycine zipper family protein n=1 Tax=Deinococcus rubellus TaxID=1889240 RepID=A0ABY5YJ02_9DEIO|nr:hypothetical protein [Deinococcus rubellus]UWX64327.1 hypothetical protein N0D28_01230 [Deinococcus rubellus]